MSSPKDLLVVTTSSLEGIKVKTYLKPVSAHLVAGTNFFSDFAAGITDVFGGRSQTYQRQLTSLYNDAIERVKVAAYDIGANCILGLKIDMDEISGKGKSMFMLTAIGTAAIIEKASNDSTGSLNSDTKLENLDVEMVNILRNKKNILAHAEANTLQFNDEVWEFLISNSVKEAYPYILRHYFNALQNQANSPEIFSKTDTLFHRYLNSLEDDKKVQLLYDSIRDEGDDTLVQKLQKIVKDQLLFDSTRVMELLKSQDFEVQKRGLKLSVWDKAFYSKQDVETLKSISSFIDANFLERGKHGTKKQLLSSKEKEIWVCECGKSNNIGEYCFCGNDIYGFKMNEIRPKEASNYIRQKIELISEFLA
jgi:uncharacterized protein YbjQ (UPF0145 family)/CDGSH-type Zn-finger protein